jgi:UPF0716 protein FxsA
MPLPLILLFPLAEIAAFILVGGAIGLARTLLFVIASSVIGWVMLRDAGIATALRLQRGGNPATALADGGVRMTAGLLLLVPGFLTDIAAVLILFAPTRRFLMSFVAPRASASKRTDVVDGEFRRIDHEG